MIRKNGALVKAQRINDIFIIPLMILMFIFQTDVKRTPPLILASLARSPVMCIMPNRYMRNLYYI